MPGDHDARTTSHRQVLRDDGPVIVIEAGLVERGTIPAEEAQRCPKHAPAAAVVRQRTRGAAAVTAKPVLDGSDVAGCTLLGSEGIEEGARKQVDIGRW